MGSAGLPEQIDSLEDVDERVHQFYDKTDNGYRLTKIDNLLSAKNREKEEKRRYKEMVKDYEDKLGHLSEGDIEELISLKESKKKEEQRKLEEKRQWEALKRQMEENHERQLSELRQEANKNWVLLEEYVRNDHLRRELENRNVTETGKDVIPQLVKDRVRLVLDDDGRPNLRFLDQHGSEIMVNGKNDDYTLDDFMEEISGRYDDLFLGANKSGTGAYISAKHSAKANKLPSNMSHKEKADFVSTHGEEAFKRLLMLDLAKKREARSA